MALDDHQLAGHQRIVEARDIDERFGAALRRLRDARGWSLSYVGEICGTSGANISKIERGQAKEYSLPLLMSLAAAYGMRLYELFASLELIDVSNRAIGRDEQRLLEAYEAMSEGQRRVLVSVATALRPVE